MSRLLQRGTNTVGLTSITSGLVPTVIDALILKTCQITGASKSLPERQTSSTASLGETSPTGPPSYLAASKARPRLRFGLLDW
jgi:hypothetical protein